jgi:ATP-binding cassette subfamily A (ABC1) protein 3
MPLTINEKQRGQERNSGNLVFFVSVAFSLIPANFITIIIRERETNTKHLQIISGISLASYWISNFIFELLKYYFIGGINLLLILAFNDFPPWLWLVYLAYGFSMISFTYMFSIVFKTEAMAQNFVILINLLFGAIGGTVIAVLRILDASTVDIGKIISYILRVIPSFCFAFSYNELLSAILLFTIDYPSTFYLMDVNTDIIKLEYVGADLIYMACEFFLFVFVLIIYESTSRTCQTSRIKENKSLEGLKDINDSGVIKEIDKAAIFENENYSIRVKNLYKQYGGDWCCGQKPFIAVNNLSFCLNYGECFALLGVNGAGKTTTFKALTCEHIPNFGEIYINGLDVLKNFQSVRNLIGYCPQFDAIFDYMTVYENLEFYARIKGIPSDKQIPVINSMIKEMNLTEYENKVSGKLSGGNKRKLSVAIAMIGNPPIVLLDEPSTGMDPEARRFMWAVIHKISTKRKQSSVILTTHSMEEAETLCRRMGIMVQGQFKCLGTSQGIKDKYGFGFEIDLRIMHIPENILIDYTNNYRCNISI